jgi:hypothetical protein
MSGEIDFRDDAGFVVSVYPSLVFKTYGEGPSSWEQDWLNCGTDVISAAGEPYLGSFVAGADCMTDLLNHD